VALVVPFDAVNVIGNVPPVPVAGVPLNTPVEVLNDRPLGSVPDSLNVGVGKPVVVTVKFPGVPTRNVVLFALVKAGGVTSMSVKLWVASGLTPLEAVNVIAKGPTTPPDRGVPLKTPVALLNVTPSGKTPVSVNVGAGKPEAVTVKVPAVPTVKVTPLVLVIAGA